MYQIYHLKKKKKLETHFRLYRKSTSSSSPRASRVFLVFALSPPGNSLPALFVISIKGRISKSSQKSKHKNTMYPKVKVREEKYQDDEHVAVGLQLLESLSLHDLSSPETEHKDVSPVFIARIPKSPLRNVVTLTNSTHRETEQNHKKIDEREKPNIIGDEIMTDDSIALTIAEQNHKKIDEKEKPNIIGAAFLTDDSTLPTGVEKNDVKINEKEKQNIRASAILRPRAVLSSPDNDAVIGNKNRLKAERPVSLRDHDMIPNRHAKAQCKASPLHIKSQLNTASYDDVPANKSDLTGKKVTSRAVPSQRRDLRTWKF